jgi:inward rectifier potassium channel
VVGGAESLGEPWGRGTTRPQSPRPVTRSDSDVRSRDRLARQVGPWGHRFLVHGLQRRPWSDLYHVFMTISWTRLFAIYACFFFLFNFIFAGLYSLQPSSVANLNPPGYWGRYFFSVETLATVGYGDMHPQTPYAHIVASLEIFTGVMCLALIGMMFARFSRPRARVLFARYGVIRPFDGRQTLMLRAANARESIIMEATAQLRLIRDEVTVEGYSFRRIYDLQLRRSAQPVFLFGWNLLHVIDETSPLKGATAETLEATQAYLLLTITGTDETTGQTLMARQEYAGAALRWNYTFADVFTMGKNGVDTFDYTKFDVVEPLN